MQTILYILPELFLSSSIMILLMIGVFVKKSFKLVNILTITSLSFGLKSHYIKDINSKFDQKLQLVKDIKKNFSSIERIIIPIILGINNNEFSGVINLFFLLEEDKFVI